MYQSRCGICCEACEKRHDVNCKGCLNMAETFWGGPCEVKICCEEKTLAHCGLCSDFPCAKISIMGVEQGYDPAPRLAQCRAWAGGDA